jgi:hypothetical protein
MMERLIPLLLLTLLSTSAWANPCATGGRPFPVGEGSGMGGTGLQADQSDGSGIGGTGHRDGSGMGGTGQQAHTDGSGAGGTGVVGVITGFGSICVNEIEIHYDAKTPVSVNGESSRSDQLAVGQMVAVRAEGKGANLHAKHIQVRHTLVGRVEAVNQDGQLKVWGQWVSPPLMSRVQPGNRIKVSGYRADAKHVVASRIDPALAGEPDLLTGEVEWTQAGEARVSGVRIRLPTGGERLQPGQEIRVSGRPEAGGFRAERIEVDGLRGFMDKLDRLNLKDRIRPSSQPGKLRVGGADFSLDVKTWVKGASARDLQPGRLVQIEARLKEGRAVIERIEIRDETGAHGREKPNGEAAKAKRSATGETRDASRVQESADRDDHEDHEAYPREEEGEHEISERGEFRDAAANETRRDEKSERPEKTEKAEKVEKVEREEKPEKLERNEKVEKSEKVEKPERSEKPEKVEKPEKPEKVERPERPERDED